MDLLYWGGGKHYFAPSPPPVHINVYFSPYVNQVLFSDLRVQAIKIPVKKMGGKSHKNWVFGHLEAFSANNGSLCEKGKKCGSAPGFKKESDSFEVVYHIND